MKNIMWIAPIYVKLTATRSESRAGFRRIASQAETLGEFRYVKSKPFRTAPGSIHKVAIVRTSKAS